MAGLTPAITLLLLFAVEHAQGVHIGCQHASSLCRSDASCLRSFITFLSAFVSNPGRLRLREEIADVASEAAFSSSRRSMRST